MFSRIQNFYRNSRYSFRWNRTSLTATALTFLISFTVTLAIANKRQESKIANQKTRLTNIANEYAIDIQRNLERTLSVTYAVSTLVQDYKGIIPNFETVAQDLLSLYPGACALALLPENGDLKIVSVPNSAVVVNSDLLKNLYPQKTSVYRNREQVFLVIADSANLKLANGIGYLPIFLQDEREKSSFWGFATIAINFSELLKDLSLENLEKENVTYQLWQKNLDSEKKIAIAGSEIPLGDNPVKQIINVADNTWVLELTPVVGWKNDRQLWLYYLLAFAFSIILSSIVRVLLDFKVSVESEAIAFDPLTSLPNRRLLLYSLEKIIIQSKRTETITAICHLNLDNFKQVNARLGCKAGDYIIVRVAKRLQKFLRAEDIIARISGDNFAIVLQGLSSIREVELVVERIINALVSPMTIDSEVVSISASVGIVAYPQSNDNIEHLLNYADRAMRYAKKNNKGGYSLFHNLKTTTT